jgi:glycosyltransferase involved in cell wall biosynthesis
VRICLVTLDFVPFRSSGLAVYTESLAHGLVERGHEVTVLAAHRTKSEQVEATEELPSLTVVRVAVGRWDWVGLGWEAARYLNARRNEFDVIHFADVHFAYACRGSFVASAFQSFRQRLTSHGGHPYHTSRRNYVFRFIYYNVARYALEKPSLRRAQRVIMPSQATRAEFVDHYGLNPARTSLVYPGIDPGHFADLPDRAVARVQLGLKGDMPVLLYIGFSTPRKGVEYLAQAFQRMHTQAYLAMVGKWEDGYRARFCEQLGHAADRVLIAGYVPDADLPIYLGAADVFVLPTLLEGFGIPLAEAMAANLPIVTTSAGSAGEVAGDAGLVVPPADAGALAQALDRILNDRSLADSLRAAGRRRVEELFNVRRTVIETEAIYDQVAGTR